MAAGTVILGIGNLLMGDEGVGVHAIERLRARAWPDDVVLVDGGTGGFHLLGWLQVAPRVIMIDATADGQPAGTVSLLRPRYASDFPRSLTAHDIGLRDLVEAAALTGTLPEILLVTVSIDVVRPMVTTLSPVVRDALALVEEGVRSCFLASRQLEASDPDASSCQDAKKQDLTPWPHA